MKLPRIPSSAWSLTPHQNEQRTPFLSRAVSVAARPGIKTLVFQRFPPPRTQKSWASSPRLRTTNFTRPALGFVASEIRPSTSLTRTVCAAPAPIVGIASAAAATAAANRIPTVFFIWAISFVCRLGGLVVVGAVARPRLVVVSSAVVVGAAVRARAVVVAVAIVALQRAAVRARAVVVVTVVGRGAAGAARVVRVLGLVARTADVLAGRGADGRRGLRLGRGRFVRRRARRGEATGRVVRDGTTRERAACGEQHEGRQPDDQLAHCSSFWHGHSVANDLPRAGQARSRGAESLG